jgi:hypothetical protein
MKIVILKEQYLNFKPGSELTFLVDSEAAELIDKDIAFYKSLDNAPKDKMIRKSKRK